MNHEQQTTNSKPGFSLSEVLMAVGILAVGLMFIAGTFPVGIGLTTTAAERTIAAVVADEAFAKIKLYGIDLENGEWPEDIAGNVETDKHTGFENVIAAAIEPNEFAYPSIDATLPPQYYWSALCRLIDAEERLVQVTVFVSRKTGPATRYPDAPDGPEDIPLSGKYNWLVPVAFPGGGHFRSAAGGMGLWAFLPDFQYDLMGVINNFIKPGATIMDDATGRLYRIQQIIEQPDILILMLDGPGPLGGDPSEIKVWVVPRPVGGGRYPCIGIYQRIMRF